ncbi:MAG TPA: hypothetical protein VGE36_11830 [Roseateles sp.]
MNRTTTLSLMLAAAGLALFGWIAYDASDAAALLGLSASVGEAGVALGGLFVSLTLLAMAAALPLRRRRERRLAA